MTDDDGVLGRDGYLIVPAVLSDSATSDLCGAVSRDLVVGASTSRRGGAVYAMRNVLGAIPAVRGLARSNAIRTLVEPVLGAGCIAVRAILFDKVAGANWNLSWHQDLSVALAERVDLPQWAPWSIKADAVHAHAPAAVLERMLAVRLHLDPCLEENGPLRVLPGSHRFGRVDGEMIERLRSSVGEVVCAAARGDAVPMRPLLLHASSAAAVPHYRRVLHVEFAEADLLPSGMHWRDAVGAREGLCPPRSCLRGRIPGN